MIEKLPFYHPSRPLIGTIPSLLHPITGTPLSCGIPAMNVIEHAGGVIDIFAFLPNSYNASSPKYYSCTDLESAFAALREWFAGPEVFAYEKMGWRPVERWERTRGTTPVKGTVTGRLPPAAKVLDEDDLDF